ncbi:hypothetical protein [Micromonospora lutea]|uniref:DUF916 domain-containing protein n=1 Tax=Micromonospora lutea TaxID=419825 RepID=A0ABQ4IXS0_9ACTN|nr:hypothetical protein [Micromonospora lutea]GIJ22708.1 hypothetical protein Vlu01_33320 [Micromonospora lutea]
MAARSGLARRAGLTALLLITALVGTAAAAGGPDASRPGHRADNDTLGIRLLEVSSNRRDDPRAQLYIVDHVNPGTTITRRFAVSNNSRATQKVLLRVSTAEIRDNTFVPSADPDANELPTWITVDRPDLVIPPHSRVELTATIAVPSAAPRGERYGVLVASIASPTPGTAGNVQIVNGVGVRIYLDVGPGGDPPSDFMIERLVPGRTEDGHPIVRADVRNTGERALDIDGQLWLSDTKGKINAGPFEVRQRATLMPGGVGQVIVEIDEQLSNGPWHAKLTLTSGRIRRTFTGTLTFPDNQGAWGLPATISSHLPLLLGIAGAVGITGVALVLLNRARRTRQGWRPA